MLIWIAALVAGLLLAALAYRVPPALSDTPVFALRAIAGALLIAMLFDAPLGPRRPVRPWIGLDASASWSATGDPETWQRALRIVDSIRAAGADSLFLFGDTVRADSAPTFARDRASRVGELVDAATAVGRPLVVVTDGGIDDPERISRLPRGSRVIVVPFTARPDAAIARLDTPGGALGGDTVTARLVVRAGLNGSGSTTIVVKLDDRTVSSLPLPALEPEEEREFRVPIPIPLADATRRIGVSLEGGDAVPQNDTLSAALVVSGAAAATFVSTAPDQDARFALSVLRGTRRGPVQGFWRVAPGQWRTDGGLQPVAESAVRQAAAGTPLLVIHGDTAVFGAPRSLTHGALVLIPPPPPGDDYYPTGTDDSPIAASLSGVPWDSLPPVEIALSPPRGFSAIVARRARRLDERVLVHLEDGPRRTALVPASGLWRWRLRGGRAANAFDAVWGSIFDWVGAEPRSASAPSARGGASSEWVPRRATVISGAVGDGAQLDSAPRALGAWWLSLLAISALCAEWILRRRIGLR